MNHSDIQVNTIKIQTEQITEFGDVMNTKYLLLIRPTQGTMYDFTTGDFNTTNISHVYLVGAEGTIS